MRCTPVSRASLMLRSLEIGTDCSDFICTRYVPIPSQRQDSIYARVSYDLYTSYRTGRVSLRCEPVSRASLIVRSPEIGTDCTCYASIASQRYDSIYTCVSYDLCTSHKTGWAHLRASQLVGVLSSSGHQKSVRIART